MSTFPSPQARGKACRGRQSLFAAGYRTWLALFGLFVAFFLSFDS